MNRHTFKRSVLIKVLLFHSHGFIFIWVIPLCCNSTINEFVSVKTQLCLGNRVYVSTEATCFDLVHVTLKLNKSKTYIQEHILQGAL
jgi:hypothetical protein